MLPREVVQFADELVDRAKAQAKSELPSGFEPPDHH
jgi:hypothetical protein